MSTTELAVVPEGKYAIQQAGASASTMREEFGEDFVPKFNRVQVPGAGSTTWEDAQGNASKELTGVIVAVRKFTRLYLEKGDGSEDSKRADAYSYDGKTQIISPGAQEKAKRLGLPPILEDLSRCPYYKWFGDEGAAHLPDQKGGKATREYREVYLVTTGSAFPQVLQVPTTSLKAADEHLNQLAQTDRMSLSGYESILTLEKHDGGSFKWSTVNFKIGERLGDADFLAARELGKNVRAFIQRDSYATETHAPQETAVQAEVVTPVPVEEFAAASVDKEDITF